MLCIPVGHSKIGYVPCEQLRSWTKGTCCAYYKNVTSLIMTTAKIIAQWSKPCGFNLPRVDHRNMFIHMTYIDVLFSTYLFHCNRDQLQSSHIQTGTFQNYVQYSLLHYISGIIEVKQNMESPNCPLVYTTIASYLNKVTRNPQKIVLVESSALQVHSTLTHRSIKKCHPQFDLKPSHTPALERLLFWFAVCVGLCQSLQFLSVLQHKTTQRTHQRGWMKTGQKPCCFFGQAVRRLSE